MSITGFSFPTAIKFGAGARKLVADHLKEQGLKRPLIVTDKALAALPVLARVQDAPGNGLDVAVFGGVFGNPTCSQVMDGAAAYKAHNADCVIGFGGGAALDVAKVVGIAATHEGDILEYVWDHPQVRPITQPAAVFRGAAHHLGHGLRSRALQSVVSENDTHLKRVVFSPKILAKCVFADPELTLGLPPHVTAATGMDALTHNIESYLSPAYHPLCDGIALEGTRIAAAALVTAVNEPGNLQARSDMMMASMMGAIAFQKDLGAVHSCAHALGAVCDLHHGLANALMIDTVMAWNYEAAPAKFDELAHVCGVSGGGKNFVPWLRALKAQRGYHRAARCARREGGAHAAPGGNRHGRHLPPDQSAALHGGGFRGAVQGGDVTMAHPMDRLKIGISACFFHPDPARKRFAASKTLQFIEQSTALGHVAGRAAGDGAVAQRRHLSWRRGLCRLCAVAGRPGHAWRCRCLARQLWREPLRREWSGDRLRDEYEMALVRAFCRGRQAGVRHLPRPAADQRGHGGTLYQDIATQQPGAHAPRCGCVRPELP
jgi:alcohol dehydrogenase class IV